MKDNARGIRINIMAKINNCQEKTDAELVTLALQESAYFGCLMKRYEGKLLAYIRRLSGFDQEEAADILQNVFIKIYYNLNDFDNDLKFSSWIYRITHNETIDELRKKSVRPQIILSDDEWSRVSGQIDLEKEINQNFDRDEVNAILVGLDKKYRDVLILKFLEDYDYRDISDILQKPMGTIGTLINRAKRKFKEQYISYHKKI